MAGRLSPGWLAEQFAGAPAELVQRATEFVGMESGPPAPATLAKAASRALAGALQQPPGRGAALDLLAADALVTLALAAQVEIDPAGLGQFAGQLRAEASQAT